MRLVDSQIWKGKRERRFLLFRKKMSHSDGHSTTSEQGGSGKAKKVSFVFSVSFFFFFFFFFFPFPCKAIFVSLIVILSFPC